MPLLRALGAVFRCDGFACMAPDASSRLFVLLSWLQSQIAYFLGHLISTLFTAELLTLQWFMSKLRDGQADVIQAFMPVACITLAFSIHCSIVICCEFMESWALAVAYCVSMHVLAVDFGLFSGRFLLWLEGELRW
jgi:hypothetical protein